METNQNLASGIQKNPELWELAKKRAKFKYHITLYMVMCIFFWALWFFTHQNYSEAYYHTGRIYIPWPVWPMLGWGIGLLFHYMGAYVYPKNNSVEKEYQKLINNQS